MKSAISISSISSQYHSTGNTRFLSSKTATMIRLSRAKSMPSVFCTTSTAPHPASSKSSTSCLGTARQHHILSIKNKTNHTSFPPSSVRHRQIRHYSNPRNLTSKIFTDKNGSVVGAKTAGTRVLLLIGAVVVLWFVINYAIGAAIMMLVKGVGRMIWGSLCWLIGGLYGVLKAIVGL